MLGVTIMNGGTRNPTSTSWTAPALMSRELLSMLQTVLRLGEPTERKGCAQGIKT